MCRALADGGRRCPGLNYWHVNGEHHDRFTPDIGQEQHRHKPVALLSMTPNAIRCRRYQSRKYAAEVDAVRTINGLDSNEPIGPVLREDLWEQRHRGAGLSLLVLADRLHAVAADEGVDVDEVAERYQNQQVRPHRMTAGQRLADLVLERPDWVLPEHLVRSVEPPEDGTPNPAYLRVVRDADGAEWVLVSSYDGGEPMVWPHTEAGLKAGARECLIRVRAVDDDPEAYDAWLTENDANESGANPWTQAMSDADFLANVDGMHLTT